MAGYETRCRNRGRDELVGDRLDSARARRLTLALLLVVAGLAALHPASATARPLREVADRTSAGHPDGPFATDSGQHGIENRDPGPPTFERRAALGADSFAPQAHRSDRSLPALSTRLQGRGAAFPPSWSAGGNSSRAPPRVAGATSPLA